jgi:hypothetical protein
MRPGPLWPSLPRRPAGRLARDGPGREGRGGAGTQQPFFAAGKPLAPDYALALVLVLVLVLALAGERGEHRFLRLFQLEEQGLVVAVAEATGSGRPGGDAHCAWLSRGTSLRRSRPAERHSPAVRTLCGGARTPGEAFLMRSPTMTVGGGRVHRQNARPRPRDGPGHH